MTFVPKQAVKLLVVGLLILVAGCNSKTATTTPPKSDLEKNKNPKDRGKAEPVGGIDPNN